MLDKKYFGKIFFRKNGGNIPNDNGELIRNVSNDVPAEIPPVSNDVPAEISPVEAGPSRQDNEKDARNADSDDLSKLGSR